MSPSVLGILSYLPYPKSSLEIGEVRDLLSKGTGDLLHVGEGDVLLGTLDHADIGPMNLGELPKAFLGEAPLVPLLANTPTEMYEYLLFDSHMESVDGC